MLCDTCDNGLGLVTVFDFDGQPHITTCPTCRGVGSFCGYCGLNDSDCECDDRPRYRPERPDFIP